MILVKFHDLRLKLQISFETAMPLSCLRCVVAMSGFLVAVSSSWHCSKNHRVRGKRLRKPDLDTSDIIFLDAKFDEYSLHHVLAIEDIETEDQLKGQIVGLLYVTFSHAYGGPLEQHSLEWTFCEHLCGNNYPTLVYFTVLETLPLEVPIAACNLGGRGFDSGSREQIMALTPECAQRVLGSNVRGQGRTVRNCISQWSEVRRQDLDLETWNIALVLPYPISIFSVGDCWSHLCLDRLARCSQYVSCRERWLHLPQTTYPNAEPECLSSIRENVSLNRQHLKLLIDSLREWAPIIIQNHSTPIVAQETVSEHVRYLDALVLSLAKDSHVDFAWLVSDFGRGGFFGVSGQKHGSYNALYLAYCLVFSFGCKNQSSSVGGGVAFGPTSTLKRAFNILPPIARNMVNHIFDSQIAPKHSTIARSRFFIDVAYMLLQADFFKAFADGGGVAFGLLDSSPQGGRNWLMTEAFLIRGQDLNETFRLSDRMYAFGCRSSLDDSDVDDFIELADSVAANIIHHVFPPTALGARKATFGHKAHAWLHSHRLESLSWKECIRLVACYFSFAVDRGPEKAISRLYVKPEQWFPHWVDVVIHADDSGRDQLADDSSANATPVLFTDRSFDIPGPFHLIENVQKRLLLNLPDYAANKPGMDSSSVFFHHAYTRDAWKEKYLVNNCLHWREMFKTGPPLLQGGRVWAVFTLYLEWIIARMVLITAVFRGIDAVVEDICSYIILIIVAMVGLHERMLLVMLACVGFVCGRRTHSCVMCFTE